MSVHEILSAITEAKVALDREPQLTSRILELERSLNQSQSHNQSLEVGIIGYKRTIDELETKVRSLEVERDDMGFRELESQDKLDMLRGMVTNFTCSVEAVMPKAVEVTQAEPVAEQVEVVSTASGSSNQDQSANPLPTASSLPDSSPPVQSTIADQGATGEALGERESPLPYPYNGKTHTEVFGDLAYHIAYQDWIYGGGSHDNWGR